MYPHILSRWADNVAKDRALKPRKELLGFKFACNPLQRELRWQEEIPPLFRVLLPKRDPHSLAARHGRQGMLEQLPEKTRHLPPAPQKRRSFASRLCQ